MILERNNPIIVDIGNVAKYQFGTIFSEDSDSKRIQKMVNTVTILNVFFADSSAILIASIVPNHVAIMDTI